ncbi:cupin [Erwinia sp. CPCC 100877]|nr:cupin [Erwinia sp. CPCC 100877]
MNEPTIVNKKQALSVTKENGTEVSYFLFDKFEVHTNVIPVNCIQDWHAHQLIEEIIVLNKGSLLLEWLTDGLKRKKVSTGEVIRMNNSIHRISNEDQVTAECTIFRFVSPSAPQAAEIQSDKRVYSQQEINELLNNKKTE